MHTVFNCPGCSHANRLDTHVCSNCNRHGAMSFNKSDDSDEFKCTNCLDVNYGLRCTKCNTYVRTDFVETIWTADDTKAALVILAALAALVVGIKSYYLIFA